MPLTNIRPAYSADTFCVFSIDVEDWFHLMDLPGAPAIDTWNHIPSLVEKNFCYLLDTLDSHSVRGTCFFLGWIAERFPHLVCEAIRRGHEVASHGYGHDLVYNLSPGRFFADILRAKELLEQISGRSVLGYRAPGFSVNQSTPWFFEMVAKAGYRYDSSIFPTKRQHGGFVGFPREPSVVTTNEGDVLEIPISTARMFGRDLCFFGGGYLRLFPYRVIESMAIRVLGEGRPVVFYVHPREIDPTHPRLQMSTVRYFKSYVGLRSTARKIRKLLARFDFRPCSHLLGSM